MSKQKHTPGPWECRFAFAGGIGIVYTHSVPGSARGPRVICRTSTVDRDANAKLIAAAPDLLVALKSARDRIQIDRDSLFDCHRNPRTNTVDDDLGIQGLEEYDVVLMQADKAIAKAEGSE